MQSYAPLFAEVVDSSLWEEPLHVRVLFLTLLAVKDWDHVVRVEAHKLRRKANLSDDELLDGLKVLTSPDRRSKIPQPFEGRRIQEVEDGWLVLNGEKYQAAMVEANNRARWRKAKKNQRARDSSKGKPLPGEEQYVRRYSDGASEAELNSIVDRPRRRRKKDGPTV